MLRNDRKFKYIFMLPRIHGHYAMGSSNLFLISWLSRFSPFNIYSSDTCIKLPLNLWSHLSRQVAFHNRGNKDDFVETVLVNGKIHLFLV